MQRLTRFHAAAARPNWRSTMVIDSSIRISSVSSSCCAASSSARSNAVCASDNDPGVHVGHADREKRLRLAVFEHAVEKVGQRTVEPPGKHLESRQSRSSGAAFKFGDVGFRELSACQLLLSKPAIEPRGSDLLPERQHDGRPPAHRLLQEFRITELRCQTELYSICLDLLLMSASVRLRTHARREQCEALKPLALTRRRSTTFGQTARTPGENTRSRFHRTTECPSSTGSRTTPCAGAPRGPR